MKLVTIECRQFNEWDADTQSTILDKHSDINVSHNWWENIYYDAEIIGVKLNGFDLDRNKHCSGEFIHKAWEVAKNIISEHGECCDTYKIAKEFIRLYEITENQTDIDDDEIVEQLEYFESEFLNDILHEYSNILQREYEYLYSDEAIIETFVVNQYEFDNEGNIR